ncbi:MAG: AAA family ATPase [Treponema sp.]|nr:AAA family ATPase [Treponema sp.]
MKPEFLMLQNIGPYADAEIDFSSLDNMFLIYGNTGSGKSFIFDAITYALYGNLPKGHDGRQSDFRSTFSNETQQASIVFSFSVGKERYRISRYLAYKRMAKKGDGLVEEGPKAYFEKWNHEQNIYEKFSMVKIEEINDKINEIIGLTKDEFSKLIVLPQGEFSQFLHQKGSEKQSTLEKLFPISAFTAVMDEVKTKVDNAKAETKSVEQMIASLRKNIGSDDPEEKISKLKDVLENFEKQSKEIREEKEKLLISRTSLESLKSKAIKNEEAVAKKELIESKRSSIKELEEKIFNHEKAFVVYQRLMQLTKDRKEFQTLAAELEMSKVKLEDAKAEKSRLDGKLQIKKEDEKRLDVLKDELSALKSKVESSCDLRKKIQDFQNLCEKKLTYEKKLEKTAEEESKLFLKFQEISKNILKEEFEAGKENDCYKKILEQKHYFDKEIKDLNISISEKIQAELSMSQKNLEQTKLQETEVRISEFRKQIEHLESIREENQIALISLKLEEGKPCPVCGSMNHPHPAPHALSYEEKIDTLDFSLQLAKKNLEEWNGKKSQCIQKIFDLEEKISKCSINESSSQLKERMKILESDAEKTNAASDFLENLLPKIENARNSKHTALMELKEIKGQSDALEKDINDEKKKLFPNGETFEDLENEIRQKNLMIQTLKEQLAEFEKQYADANNTFIELASSTTEKEQNLDKLKENLESEEKSFLAEKQKRLFESEQQIISFVLDEDTLEKYKTCIESFKKDEIEVTTVLKTIHLDKTSRQIEDEIQHISQKITNLEEKQETLDAHQKEANKNLASLEKDWNSLLESEKKLNELNERDNVLNHLNDDLNGRNQLKFNSWALSMYFEEVLEFANEHFERLSEGRYRFKLGKGIRNSGTKGLDISVIDSYNGTERDASTLSGGETFEASISLALGLTDAVQSRSGGIKLDSLFIDEGFGTLDEETLEKATQILMEIGESKMVGIISHVDSFKQIAKSGLKVNKTNTGSTVQIVHGAWE